MLFLVMVVLVGLLLVLPRKGKAAIRGTAVTKDGKRVQGEIMSYDPKKKALKVRAKGKSPEWVSLEELSTIEIERPLKK